MITISIANQKGGVGKTTSSIELADCLAGFGKKVIVIDLDQQGNLTDYMNAASQNSIRDLMIAQKQPDEIIQHKGNVDIIASTDELSRAEKEFTDPSDVYILSDICEMLESLYQYDYAIVDNGPSRGLLLSMSYIAADGIIVPSECDKGAINGILAIERDISKLRDTKHPMTKAEIIGVILTKYENTTIHKAAVSRVEAILESVKGNPFIYTVRKSVKVSEAKEYSKSLQQYVRYSNPAIDYRHVAEKIIEKMEG